MSRRLKRRLAPAGWVWGTVILMALMAAMEWQSRRAGSTATEDGAAVVEALFAERRSGVDVTIQGMIDRVLADDNRESRHQRFIVRLSTGATLLIAHNIDLAERAPIAVGDMIRVSGEYEWNEQGGVVHWTHHDPAGRRPGGWLEHEGVQYR